MKDFIHDDFLLSTPAARRLYHEFAAPEPILDYHNHLPPADIADNRQFAHLTAIWLDGDHYKWRAMRANGVDERLITGDAEPFEKFKAWAATVPATLRNPLYHWTHLELKRYFGIGELLNADSAERIWHEANEQLATPELSTRGILKKFRVTDLCTTDDPTDDLAAHRRIATDPEAGTHVFPAFRPDKGLAVHRPAAWNAWIDKLAAATGRDIDTFAGLLEALDQQIEFFHAHGCRLSDHGLEHCYATPCTHKEAKAVFKDARRGVVSLPKGQRRFASFLMDYLRASLRGKRLDDATPSRGLAQQQHTPARPPGTRHRV